MSQSDDMSRIEELIKVLNDASRAYYDEASEVMSNLRYDALYDELQDLETRTGIIMPDSPTRNVGYAVQTELPKERHPSKMLSLNKTKDREELRSWLGEQEGLLSWKLDGLTIVLTYMNGRMYKAVTRGNGEIGEVVTDNARTFENIPYKIPFTGEVVIRGEAVISYTDFEKINAEIDDVDAKYKNPRNLCSGSVRQLDSRVTASRHVRLYAFTLTSADGINLGSRREDGMKWMKKQGFEVVPYVKVNRDNILKCVEEFEKNISGFELPSDGLVLTFDDLDYAGTLGTTAKFPRDSIALKWADSEAETILREIEWSPSRTGLLNPIAVFDPVELEGTTVRRASVHNVSIMKKLKLGIGDKITVYKANMIIPQIAKNITESMNCKIPEGCPVCGGRTELRTDNATETLHCTNPGCIAKHVKRFTLFVSRDAMNIEGLSEQGLLKLIGKGFIKSFPDIFDISEHADEITGMEGFGRKSYDNLTGSIDRARHTTPMRLLSALGIPGIGTATAALIANYCRNDWNRIAALSETELMRIDGIGEVTAGDFTKFFRDSKNMEMIERLLAKLEMDERYEPGGKTLEGKTFVITGALEHYAGRKELKAEIEAEGGKVAGSVSRNTDYLITNDSSSGSAKNIKAAELGVAIIDEEAAMKMLGKII